MSFALQFDYMQVILCHLLSPRHDAEDHGDGHRFLVGHHGVGVGALVHQGLGHVHDPQARDELGGVKTRRNGVGNHGKPAGHQRDHGVGGEELARKRFGQSGVAQACVLVEDRAAHRDRGGRAAELARELVVHGAEVHATAQREGFWQRLGHRLVKGAKENGREKKHW